MISRSLWDQHNEWVQAVIIEDRTPFLFAFSLMSSSEADSLSEALSTHSPVTPIAEPESTRAADAVTVMSDQELTARGLTCPICLSFFCEPLSLSCGHALCRICLLQSTRLCPDGRNCPMCRVTISIKDPLTHPVDADLEARVRASVPEVEYSQRAEKAAEELEELQKAEQHNLPVFYMRGGCRVGQQVCAHLRALFSEWSSITPLSVVVVVVVVVVFFAQNNTLTGSLENCQLAKEADGQPTTFGAEATAVDAQLTVVGVRSTTVDVQRTASGHVPTSQWPTERRWQLTNSSCYFMRSTCTGTCIVWGTPMRHSSVDPQDQRHAGSCLQ